MNFVGDVEICQLLSHLVRVGPNSTMIIIHQKYSLSDGVGLLLLCEAAVKPFHALVNSDFNADEGCKGAKALCVNLYMSCNRQLTSTLRKGHKRYWQVTTCRVARRRG
jgi:hypothetical protein